MKANKAGRWAIPILVLFAMIPAFGQAPPEGQVQPDDQPPATAPAPAPAQAPGPGGAQNGPGVARVSFIRGDVTMQRGDSGDFSSVSLNTPLMAGDKIATGDGSRGELQLDYANILRLDQHSEANIATLDNNRIQVQVGQGTANYSVLNGAQADAEIDTPNVSVHPVRPGRYRVQVNSDGESVVTVGEGEAQVSTSEGSTTVKKGQLITIRGTGTEAQYKIGDAPGGDEFDNWNRDRDNTIYNAMAYQNQKTNRYYTGAGDLDNYGVWSEVPDYGPVWIPRVDYGWAPYRAGRWLWEPYWGWTWSSYEPWGWAPYHYGRWFLNGGAWAWWPGPIYPAYRPIWAPAYVSFFGFGGGVGFGIGFGLGGFGFGSIGWLPIGPGDFFHPWWGGFRDRFGVVGFDRLGGLRDGIAPLHAGDRFSNLRNVMANDRLRQGVSGMPAGSFGRGSVMPRTVAAADIRGGRMMTGNLPVVPTRDSLRASDRPVNSATASRMSSQRSFFSRSAPSARSESFSSQAAHVNDAIARDGHFQAINGSGTARFTNGNLGSAARSSSGEQGQIRGAQGQASGASAGQSYGASGANGAFNRGNQGASDGWQRFSSSGGRANTSNGYASRSTSGRPTLDMSKPIVNERSYRSSGSSYGGTNRGSASPAYRSAPSSPSYRGYSSSQPSYRSAPSSRPSGSSSYGGPRGSGGSSRGSSGHSSGRSSGGHSR